MLPIQLPNPAQPSTERPAVTSNQHVWLVTQLTILTDHPERGIFLTYYKGTKPENSGRI